MFRSVVLVCLAFLGNQLYSQNSSRTFKITPDIHLIIEKSDITKSPAQAIVNAANAQLEGGAGVCGAIFKAAGWDKLQAACNKYALKNGERCPVGQARITDSFNLKHLGIRSIIHAVGPDCRIVKDEARQDALLMGAYKNSLQLADQNKIQSIAFPFISSAIYAFPKERASYIALKTVFEYARKNKTSINSIRFALFSQEDFELFCKVSEAVQ
jgi:O-acetyl-ADP-ribose deacetylase (regulator of RNase III)